MSILNIRQLTMPAPRDRGRSHEAKVQSAVRSWSQSVIQAQSFGVGAKLLSGLTITPTDQVHQVSGTNAIKTITPFPNGFNQPLHLIPLDAWTTITGGNISKASTAIPYQMMTFIYDGSLWHASY